VRWGSRLGAGFGVSVLFLNDVRGGAACGHNFGRLFANVMGAGATGGCYANCDNSTSAPALNVNDFNCFLNRFRGQDPYANCDGSTSPPTLNVNDFQCFLKQVRSGVSVGVRANFG